MLPSQTFLYAYALHDYCHSNILLYLLLCGNNNNNNRPDETKSGPFDWSPFQPVEDRTSKNLTFATSKGMEQFGCCPKTAGNANRRVLFGWINNGWDQGPGEPDRPDNSYSNNTLSLPRDLSITQSGQLRQQFVPELAQLRTTRTHVGTQPLAAGGVPNA